MVGDRFAILLAGLTHLIRSCVESSSQSALRQEVAELRVEVHRARSLVEDYNFVLDSCEKEAGWLRFTGRCAASFNIALGLICLVGYLWHLACNRSPRLSRDSEPSIAGVTAHAELGDRRSGPVRPSDLGRSRRDL